MPEFSGKRKLRVMLSNKDYVSQIQGIRQILESVEKVEKEFGIRMRILNYGTKQSWGKKLNDSR